MNVTCKLLSEITTTNKFTWLTKIPLHVMAPTAKWRRLDPVVLFSNDPGQNTNVVWNGLKGCYNTIIIFNQRPWPLKQKNRRRIPRLYFKKRGSEVSFSFSFSLERTGGLVACVSPGNDGLSADPTFF